MDYELNRRESFNQIANGHGAEFMRLAVSGLYYCHATGYIKSAFCPFQCTNIKNTLPGHIDTMHRLLYHANSMTHPHHGPGNGGGSGGGLTDDDDPGPSNDTSRHIYDHRQQSQHHRHHNRNHHHQQQQYPHQPQRLQPNSCFGEENRVANVRCKYHLDDDDHYDDNGATVAGQHQNQNTNNSNPLSRIWSSLMSKFKLPIMRQCNTTATRNTNWDLFAGLFVFDQLAVLSQIYGNFKIYNNYEFCVTRQYRPPNTYFDECWANWDSYKHINRNTLHYNLAYSGFKMRRTVGPQQRHNGGGNRDYRRRHPNNTIVECASCNLRIPLNRKNLYILEDIDWWHAYHTETGCPFINRKYNRYFCLFVKLWQSETIFHIGNIGDSSSSGGSGGGGDGGVGNSTVASSWQQVIGGQRPHWQRYRGQRQPQPPQNNLPPLVATTITTFQLRSPFELAIALINTITNALEYCIYCVVLLKNFICPSACTTSQHHHQHADSSDSNFCGAVDLVCPVCYEHQKNTTLVPCGHMFCGGCAVQVDTCPSCRVLIGRRQRTYI